jgi:hypothetical protein
MEILSIHKLTGIHSKMSIPENQFKGISNNPLFIASTPSPSPEETGDKELLEMPLT